MDTIDEPLALPFRLGVAYPLRGEVIGEGVGAVRQLIAMADAWAARED